jgi:hypothetical protein
MKSRIYMLFNFFAFNLLFFALYLNFIHKDTAAAIHMESSPTTAQIKSPSGSIESIAKEKKDAQKTTKNVSPAIKEGGASQQSIN